MNHSDQLSLASVFIEKSAMFQQVALKSGESIRSDMMAGALTRGAAGAGIGAAGGAILGAMAPEEKRRRRVLMGLFLGGAAGGGIGAYGGADSAFRNGVRENADILNQTADNMKVFGVPVHPPMAAEYRRHARDLKSQTLLKALLDQ